MNVKSHLVALYPRDGLGKYFISFQKETALARVCQTKAPPFVLLLAPKSFSRETCVVVAESRRLGEYFISFSEKTGSCACLWHKSTRNSTMFGIKIYDIV
jgi:hypothetical protein